MIDKVTLMRNFSKYASLYDRYANIQKLLATKLLNQIRENNFKRILEIGCGTGNYTLLLRDKFGKAKIKAIDISERMIEVASKKLKDKEIDFIIADAEFMNLNTEFDLITSNACFQWFEDLEETLMKYKNLLKNNGQILFSTFGPLTFRELKCTYQQIEDVSIQAEKFASLNDLRTILNKNFKETAIKETRYAESFFNLKDLLYKIKYTGIRGNGLASKIFLGKQSLNKIEKIYLDKFKQIKATYQVFFCQGKK